MKTISRPFLLFLWLMVGHLWGLAQSKTKYPDLNKVYTKQQMLRFLNEYQKKQDTLGIVYTYALWRANISSFEPEEDKKAISTIYKYKDRVKKHSEEDYHYMLLDLAVYHNGDYKSLTNSLAICDSVLLYAQKKGNKTLRRKALSSKAYMLMDKNETKDIFKILNELYTYRYQWQKDSSMKREYYYQLGYAYLKTKRYQQAIACFQEVNRPMEGKTYLRIRHLSILFLAQCYRLSGDLKNAARYASLGLDMTKGINNIYLQRWSYEELALINHEQNNHQTEVKYWLQYWKTEQAIRAQNISQINRSGINFELLEAELRESNTQTQLMMRENEQKKLITNGLFVICTLLLLLLGVAIWTYRQRVKIATQQKQMALYEGQEQERTTIAKDLHDHIGSTLAGIKARLSPNTPDFELITKNLDEVYQHVRTLSHTLHTDEVVQTGLVQACRDFVNLIDRQNLITFKVYGAEKSVSSFADKMIYRVIQELLTNALKHSAASWIKLNIFFEDTNLLISIEDNGVGFDKNNYHQGIGLKNIIQRIDTLNGHLDINSSTDGTSFLISIPFNTTI